MVNSGKPMMTLEQLQEIGKSYDLIVTQMDDEELVRIGMDRDYFVNSSQISGDHVWVGFFEDPEKMLASFFHEIGHRVSKEYLHGSDFDVKDHDLKQARETMAWFLGLREAALRSIYFSDTALAWAVGRVMTYKDYE